MGWILPPNPPPPPPPAGPPGLQIAPDLAAYMSQWDTTGDLQIYAAAIGQMFAEVESYALDTDTAVGWQPLWDYTIAPHNALPWLAMIMGETLPAGSTDNQARALIAAAPNQQRGAPQAIANAVKQTLTGGQLVGLKERWNGSTEDDDALSIVTWASQTPNTNAVLGALRSTVPADIAIYYQTLTGETWGTLEGGSPSWATIESTYGPAWSNIEGATALPGYVIY